MHIKTVVCTPVLLFGIIIFNCLDESPSESGAGREPITISNTHLNQANAEQNLVLLSRSEQFFCFSALLLT